MIGLPLRYANVLFVVVSYSRLNESPLGTQHQENEDNGLLFQREEILLTKHTLLLPTRSAPQ